MTDSPAPDLAEQAAARSRINAGWPLLVAVAVWAVGLPLLPQLAADRVTGTATATLVGLAILSIVPAGLVLLRMPADRVTGPFVALAAAVGTLLALAPLDRPAAQGALVNFLLVAPWRYALTPLVVHFALEVGWSHRRPRWAGWIIGWYAVVVGMLLVVAVGLVMDEAALVDAVDHTFRASILEPAGAATALIGTLFALATPVRGRVLRRALLWTVGAIGVGLAPLLLAENIPVLAQVIDGAATPARLALLALPAFGVVAVLSLPFRDALARDLVAHRLAAGLLEGELSTGLQQLAAVLHESFNARGVAIRITEPETLVTIGEVLPQHLTGPLVPEMEANEERQELVAPIGRAGAPLGEVRLEGRFAGAFGPTERSWLAALLQPVSAVLRLRRREVLSDLHAIRLTEHLQSTLGALASAAHDLPLSPADAGMAVPPPVDAREVLSQMSDGVTGIARSGEGLATSANEARDRARRASDAVARGLDALSALSVEVARLARYGEEIAASNETVSGVAFRTNLLANNAALEAARAGAAGRTFGVLAEEVRRLADTTAATSVAIGEHTATLAAGITGIGTALDGTRQALAAAIREAEAGEAAAQRLNDAASELEDTARGLRPVVAEANAVAKRRTARDHHLTATMERFLNERAALSRALTAHRDSMDKLASTLGQLSRSG